MYRATRALGGANLTESQRNDKLLQKNMASIDQIIRQHERQESADLLAARLLPIIAPVGPGPRGGRR